MTTMTALPGDATAIRNYGTRYEAVAERILAVARSLESLVDSEQSSGESIEQLKQNASQTATAVRTAQPRYHETALALVEFSVDLADAQQKANSAISDANGASNELGSLNYRRDRREEDRLDALMANESEEELDRIERDIRSIDREIGEIEQAVSQATGRYQQAVEDRERAIVEAVNRIKPALDQLNDGVLDYVRSAFESLVAFTEAIAQWIGTIFTALVDALLKLIVALIVAVILVILVIVLIALVLAVVAIAILLIPSLILAALALIILAITALVVRSVIREAITPTPDLTVRHYDPDKTDPYERSEDEGNYENVFNNNAQIDDLGGSDSTNIEIVTIRDADGNIVGYRVVLPSTQDWEEANGIFNSGEGMKGDQGAVNDLGSNVALMMTPPELRGPYERAVIEALQAQMAADGASPNTPVMLAGFSQGGILAARMAADPHSPFNINAVVTAGSCVDGFNIPSSVSVLSLQHIDDPVPMLDFNPTGDNNIYNPLHNPNSNQVTVPAVKKDGEAAHGADSYTITAGTYLDHSTNPQVQQIVADQAMFFSDHESVSIYTGSE